MTTPRHAAAALALALALPALAADPPTAATTVVSPGGTTTTLHQAPVDELTAAVVAYPITLEKVERYARGVKALRAAAARDGKLKAALHARPAGPVAVAEEARRMEAIPEVKAILDRHGLAGRDLLLLPQAVLAGRAALFAERAGRAAPPDRVNAASVALLRAEPARMDRLTQAFMKDLQALGQR